MGKSKKVKSSNNDTKAEKRYKRLKNEFEKGTLTRKQVYGMPHEKMVEYLKRKLREKYHKDDVNFDCVTCAVNAAFDNERAVTDDELRQTIDHFKQ
jgi:hypothetical protein